MDLVYVILGLIIIGLAVGLTISVIKLSNVRPGGDGTVCGNHTTYNAETNECVGQPTGSQTTCGTYTTLNAETNKCEAAVNVICERNTLLKGNNGGIGSTQCVAKEGSAICSAEKCNATDPDPSSPSDSSSSTSMPDIPPVGIAAIVMFVISAIALIVNRSRSGGIPTFLRRSAPPPRNIGSTATIGEDLAPYRENGQSASYRETGGIRPDPMRRKRFGSSFLMNTSLAPTA